ncbi:unnamed protein product [Adineta steineri]|uniref:Bulb-type lectin domain-containing protein n=1 Tax=Adineta steineri TaxID=433720 RepID=A0A814HVB3_9BILA|nr:unnamed protein product [Adineta steineri]CAF1513552.1 unnamed protein product [Adineta steineri]CAF3729399.1 unnamed protein product [Adineta steineri]CAF3971119.1 unnamed protein product [Adineta steineri]
MLAKSTFSCVFIVVLSLFVRPSQQDLKKRPVFEGLSDKLNFGHLRTPSYTSTPGGDAKLCHCNGAAPQSVRTITYIEMSNRHSLVLCICPNAVMNATYMIEMMGRVPYAIRRYNKAMVSATSGTCGGAGSSKDVSFYCDPNMQVSVFIHESAHSTDRDTSGTNQWHNAVQQDSCVPDPYANSNIADDFAQVVVLWTHLVGQGLHPTLGGEQFSCMRNQLQQIKTKLPPFIIQPQRSHLSVGQELRQGEALTSPNGNYYLVMQEDGNLVLYVSEKFVHPNALWKTRTLINGPHRFHVQPDGNLVTYDSRNRSTWASNTCCQNAERSYLAMQDDGNVVFYNKNHQPIWHTNTCCHRHPRE